MATFVNSTAGTKHNLFQSSNLKSTDIGNIWDVLVRDDNDDAIDCDNGVGLVVGEYTGNGLQERYGKIAKKADKVAIAGSAPIIKSAMTKAQNSELNFYNKAGDLVKAYEVVEGDIFAVALHSFTDATLASVKVGAYANVDGDGMWEASVADPGAVNVGGIFKIHSIVQDVVGAVTLVRLLCIQNVQL